MLEQLVAVLHSRGVLLVMLPLVHLQRPLHTGARYYMCLQEAEVNCSAQCQPGYGGLSMDACSNCSAAVTSPALLMGILGKGSHTRMLNFLDGQGSWVLGVGAGAL